MSGAPKVFLRTTGTAPAGASAAAQFHACVRNTGNYFFEESLLRQIPGLQVCDGLDALPGHIATLVLSMSNFISPTTDLGYLHDALRQHRVEQVVMIGAGAQAYEYGEDIRLTPGTRRFLHFVADRSHTIGVRGCHTADVLARMGFGNVEVIGCPSAFWAGAAPRLEAPRRLPERPRLAVHSTPLGHYRDKVSALMAHGMRHGADYVLQSEAWMMPLLGGGGDEALLHENLLFYAYPDCDPAALRAWLERRLLTFFGMQPWIRHLGTYDFVYGSRFHGNMAAIQAGVPALNMPFDTRTRELCDTLNLPALPLASFHADIPLERLREMADFTLYCRTYPDRLATYAGFLRRNGLDHALGLAPGRSERPAPPPASPAWSVKLAALRRLLSDLEASGECGGAALHAAAALRLRDDRDAGSRAAAEDGRLDDIAPFRAPWPDIGNGGTVTAPVGPGDAPAAAPVSAPAAVPRRRARSSRGTVPAFMDVSGFGDEVAPPLSRPGRHRMSRAKPVLPQAVLCGQPTGLHA